VTLTAVCRVNDIPPGRGWPVRVAHLRLAVFADKGEIYVLDNLCLHALATIDDGSIDDGCVVCPWHGWRFDLASGDHLTMFGSRPGLRRYASTVEDGWVMVDPEVSTGGASGMIRW
jgi:nitrite reductase/ring-hydroxylating ferredoxin subunit